MPALYRKYRPQNFSEVVGQGPIVQTLKNAVESGNVAHAYLFTGSRGVGKTSLARILASSIGTQGLDLIEIDAASNTGVENIRELIEHARFRPSLGKYKVFIIDEVHMLSKGAFNALLKTLEEPPEHVIFILATTEIHKVPATIISRTQRFDFAQLSAADITAALAEIAKKEKFKVSMEVLGLVAQRAEGSMRDALSILDKIFTLGQNPKVEDVQQLVGLSDIASCVDLFALILAQDPKAIISMLEELAARGTDFEVFNKDFLEYLRKILVYKLTGQTDGFGLAKDNLGSLTAQAEQMGAGEIMRVIRLFLRAYQESSSAPTPELPMLLSSLEVFVKSASAKATPGEAGVKTAPSASAKIALEEKPSGAQVKMAVEEVETQGPIRSEITEEVDLSKINDHWPEVLAEIKKVNSPLATVVKSSTIFGAEEDKLIFSVRFLFDKESIENPKNSIVICQAIEKVIGTKVRIGGKIVKPKEASEEKISSSLTDALTVFGGEIVE